MTQQSNSPVAQIPDLLKRLGFTKVSDVHAKKRRLVISMQGMPATGKTRFLSTCPPPIAVIDFDRGMEDVAEYAEHDGSPIYRRTLEMPDFDEKTSADSRGASAPAVSQTELQVAKKSYEEFKRLIDTLVKSGSIRTLAIDNGGYAYNLAMAARFGQIARLGEVPSQMWRLMQQEFLNTLNVAYDHDVNLVVTHREKLKFKGSYVGEKELDGYPAVAGWAQVHLALEKQVTRAKPATSVTPAVPGDLRLLARVEKCRQRVGIEGLEFEVVWLDESKEQSVGFDFLTVAQAVFPNSVQNDWF